MKHFFRACSAANLLCLVTLLGLQFLSLSGSPRLPLLTRETFGQESSWFLSGLTQAGLFLFGYSLVVRVWEAHRVDYTVLFDLPGAGGHAGSLGVSLLAAAVNVPVAMVAVAVLAFTTAKGGARVVPEQQSRDTRLNVYPRSLFVVVVFLYCCLLLVFVAWGPLARARRRFLVILLEVLIAPVRGARFVHTTLGDALTSACLMLFDLEFAVCFIGSGDFMDARRSAERCRTGRVEQAWLNPAVFMLPFWIRFVQCLYRCWQAWYPLGRPFASSPFPSSPLAHLLNSGKYFSCMLVVLSGAYATESVLSVGLKTRYDDLWVASLVLKTVYVFSWDILMDWDLGKPGSRFLRPRLLYPTKSGKRYYLAIATNLFGRVCWAIAITPTLYPSDWRLGFAVVEILRRTQWLIFRVENEHIFILGGAERGEKLLVNER
jgi:hypothetical protein